MVAQGPQSNTPVPPASTNPPQEPWSVVMKKTVVFLVITYRDGSAIAQSEGTGFFVAVPDKRIGNDGGFTYLVTNRHMADPSVALGHQIEILRFGILVNHVMPSGGTGPQLNGITIENPHWVFPQDRSVDLAVAPMGLDQKQFDYLVIPDSLFATKDIVKSREISEGDSVMFTGFFAQFPGRQKIQPIVRQGTLAMLPDEEIPTTLHLPGHLYLADMHTFHGNSGSPVFVNLGGYRNGSMMVGDQFLLLGVVSGYLYETADLKLQVATTISGEVGANSGITSIVPVDELKALLESPELRQQRDAEIMARFPHQ
jgi:hypothetical protein